MASGWKRLEEWLGGGPNGTKRIRTFRWLAVIGLTGVALMILNSFLTVREVDPIASVRGSPGQTDPARPAAAASDKTGSMFRDYEEAYESRLRDILKNIVGVGQVEVMVTIESTEETVVEKNVKDTQQTTNEKDPAGATRQITDVTRDGEVVLYQVSGGQTPVVQKYIKPKIRGVVVVAGGAENPTVKKLIAEAVERGLDVPLHRISVVPRKQ